MMIRLYVSHASGAGGMGYGRWDLEKCYVVKEGFRMIFRPGLGLGLGLGLGSDIDE